MAVSVKNNARYISDKGVDLIKSFEGLVLHPYLDQVKVPTIGYGSTHYNGGKAVTMKDEPITKEGAEHLLKFEIQAKGYVLNQSLDKYKIALNQNQYDSLLSFAYNVGIGGLLGSTLFRKLRVNPKDPTIKDEFMKWCKAHTPDGKVVTLEGLKKRRAKEAELYFK
jgi:lysozyme